MLLLLGFAFISGIVTILSPCILPVLPIVLSGSVGGKSRPYGVILGFIVSFSAFTLLLSTVVRALNIPPNILRYLAVGFIGLFGLVMIVPKLREGFELLASRISFQRKQGKPTKGFAGGLLVGASLGLVWTPCVGPILASVISLAVTQSVDSGAVFIILTYALGTSIPMLAIMLGGRKLIDRFPALSKNTGRIQQIFGVLMIVVAVSIGFGWDIKFQSAVLRVFPNYGSGLTAIENVEPVREALDERTGEGGAEAVNTGGGRLDPTDESENGRLRNYGPAPELVTDGMWFNLEELGVPSSGRINSMEELKGKVVLIDFWTYSCVNCVRTMPHLKSWYETYKDEGFVIIGVHSPEFAFERDPGNVEKAMKDLGVTWPVVLDNDFEQWRAYNNRYWPAHYFIDAEGTIRYYQYGEGEYDTAEKVIRALLKEAGNRPSGRAEKQRTVRLESRTPETYLGYKRSEGFISSQETVPDFPARYTPSRPPENGEWTLNGTWTVTGEYLVPLSEGELELGFNAKDVFLVIDPVEAGGSIEVSIDGKPVTDTPDVKDGILISDESRLYQLVDLEEPGEHILTLKVRDKVRLFAFTFG